MALTRTIVFGGFMTAFAAGLLLGFMLRPSPVRPGAPSGGRPDRESWMAQQLDLTPEQQQQMKQIWSEVSRHGPGPNSKKSQIRRDRDEAIKALVPPENLPAYEKVLADYNARNDAMDAEMKQTFGRAVERTKALLTPEQRTKYEALISRHGWDGPRERGRRSGTQPSKP